jgi:hypothetical protein
MKMIAIKTFWNVLMYRESLLMELTFEVFLKKLFFKWENLREIFKSERRE